MKNYIFGYGSLVNRSSRGITGDSFLVGAARVRGIQRGWNVQVSTQTSLGVFASPGASCNGVIIGVSEEELAKFDEREKPSLYERIKISRDDITFLEPAAIEDGLFWIYMARDPRSPDDEHPIAQSYVDVVLSGFLDFGEEYAREFVASTSGWKNLLNDREKPRYSRALKKVERGSQIDELLKPVK